VGRRSRRAPPDCGHSNVGSGALPVTTEWPLLLGRFRKFPRPQQQSCGMPESSQSASKPNANDTAWAASLIPRVNRLIALYSPRSVCTVVAGPRYQQNQCLS
jgi:hypothetical protein